MRHFFVVLCALCLACLFVACEQRPKGVLSKGDMEDVLYDYHLAQAMTDWMPDREGESNQPYLDAVFQKHGITQEEFDSSLVWYNAHADDLKDILDECKDKADEMLQLKLEEIEEAYQRYLEKQAEEAEANPGFDVTQSMRLSNDE